ncbi:25S rRNA (adenine645-N1)-methyltransferase, partial [Tulasnella sp. 417]
ALVVAVEKELDKLDEEKKTAWRNSIVGADVPAAASESNSLAETSSEPRRAASEVESTWIAPISAAAGEEVRGYDVFEPTVEQPVPASTREEPESTEASRSHENPIAPSDSIAEVEVADPAPKEELETPAPVVEAPEERFRDSALEAPGQALTPQAQPYDSDSQSEVETTELAGVQEHSDTEAEPFVDVQQASPLVSEASLEEFETAAPVEEATKEPLKDLHASDDEFEMLRNGVSLLDSHFLERFFMVVTLRTPMVDPPMVDPSSKKKRKRTLDGDDDRTDAQQTGEASRPRRRPQKTASISTLMNGMGIDSPPKAGSEEKRTLKRKKSLRKDHSLASVMDVDAAAEKEAVEEVHGRQKRLRKEPSVVEPPIVPPPPTKPKTEVPVSEDPDTIMGGGKGEKKKKKKGKEVAESGQDELAAGPSGSAPTLTPLQAAMKEKLQGSLFRQYNETIYKSDSKTFHEMVKKDPKVFTEYHVGFRHQVTSWPTNPVEHYISTLSSYPKRTMVVDLGCGDAALAKALVPKGFNVLSFDIVSDGEWVIEADVCDKVPLPGSQVGGGRVVDVVICALSLMSTNWPQCIRETRRILKDSGELKIAEVTSRFTNVKDFISLVESLGFQLTKQEQPTTHFTLFDFKVSAPPNPPISAKDWKAILKKGPTMLKPCEYKRSQPPAVYRKMLSSITKSGILAAAARPMRSVPATLAVGARRGYHEKVINHYEKPRNVGSLPKTDKDVGTGLVGAPACGDVMKLQIRVDDKYVGEIPLQPAAPGGSPERNIDPSSPLPFPHHSGIISDVKFKTFGCGSAIASSSYLTER